MRGLPESNRLALRMRACGSHFRRTALNASSRGSIARKCSGRVNVSFVK